MQNIPVITVKAETIPEAWEKAVLSVYNEGIKIKTEYDNEEDLPSLDATLIVEILKPLQEPRIHKNFPAGLEELEIYRQEVINGIHDHWIDPKSGKWTYTYHERLFSYLPKDNEWQILKDIPPINQIEKIIDKLCECSYSRRAQAITWMPTADLYTNDPPCLQRIWCRLIDEENDVLWLNMNTHWRSRDLYKAWFMNVYAITELQRVIADEIQSKLNKIVKIGRYVDIVDSCHIYGAYLVENGFENEIEKMKTDSWTTRSWDSRIFEPIFTEIKERLKEDKDYYNKTRIL